MIMSFADKRTAAVFAGLHVRQLGADILRMAQRKLAQLHRAARRGMRQSATNIQIGVGWLSSVLKNQPNLCVIFQHHPDVSNGDELLPWRVCINVARQTVVDCYRYRARLKCIRNIGFIIHILR
jgi:hypothetical protein